MQGDEGGVWAHPQPTDLYEIGVCLPELPPASSRSFCHFTAGPPNHFFRGTSLRRRSNSKSNVFKARFKSSLKHSSHFKSQKATRTPQRYKLPCWEHVYQLFSSPHSLRFMCSAALWTSKCSQLVWRSSKTEFLLSTANIWKAFDSCCYSGFVVVFVCF